jgi:dTDP-glucose 4,6-dehydratase
MKKNVIVTGGEGFIGSHLCTYLQKFYNVISIDNRNLKNPFEKLNFYKNFNFSIGNQKKVRQVLKKYKPILVFNLAAESHVDNSIKSPLKIFKNNIEETYIFLQTIVENLKFLDKDFRLIHLSTDEVYGSIEKNSQKVFNENCKLSPNSPYSSSKAAIDLIINSYNKTFSLPSIVVRSCNNFGPYQHYEKLIPKVILNSLTNKKIPVYAKGNQIREWIFVSDTVKKILLIAKKGLVGDIYNIGSGIRVSNLTIIKKILLQVAQLTKINKRKLFQLITHVKDRPGHDFKYAVCNKKLGKLIKFKLKHNLDKNIKETILWFRKTI